MRAYSMMLLALALGVTGCTIETYRCDDDDWDDDHDRDHCCGPHRDGDGITVTGSGGSNSGGAGSTGTGSGGTASAGTGSGGGGNGGEPGRAAGGNDSGAGGAPAQVFPCNEERDCAKGSNCDLGRHECVPSDAETCGELTSDDDCTARPDCVAVYAGTNCSCGPDCQCMAGQLGCTCARFEFFRCDVAE